MGEEGGRRGFGRIDGCCCWKEKEEMEGEKNEKGRARQVAYLRG